MPHSLQFDSPSFQVLQVFVLPADHPDTCRHFLKCIRSGCSTRQSIAACFCFHQDHRSVKCTAKHTAGCCPSGYMKAPFSAANHSRCSVRHQSIVNLWLQPPNRLGTFLAPPHRASVVVTVVASAQKIGCLSSAAICNHLMVVDVIKC